MKTAITISALCFIIGSIQFNMITAIENKPAEEVEKCLKKTGVTEAEIKNLDENLLKISEPNEKLQCYVKCIMDHSEILEEGKIKEAELLKNFSKAIPAAELEKAIKACESVKGKNHCETAYEIAKCFTENKVKLF